MSISIQAELPSAIAEDAVERWKDSKRLQAKIDAMRLKLVAYERAASEAERRADKAEHTLQLERESIPQDRLRRTAETDAKRVHSGDSASSKWPRLDPAGARKLFVANQALEAELGVAQHEVQLLRRTSGSDSAVVKEGADSTLEVCFELEQARSQ